MTLNPQFFRQTDIADVPGPPRELLGYGEHPPRVRWQNDAKVAVQIVVNYEEGSEKSFAMGDQVNDGLYELPFAVDGQRDLAVESMYEYGSRVGIWRMFRIFDAAAVPVTFFGAAVALVNDARYIVGTGYGSPEHFYETAKASLDRLRNDGDDLGRMMSVGLHPRITGNPARSDALARFIDYAQRLDDVTFMRRIDIARSFANQVPKP
jgi:peptidoglycan/xylan/chitin deacetylase (PgdA/CDA1 family)